LIVAEEPKLTVPVPGLKKEIGAGDVIATVTTRLGIKPCSPCHKRRDQLNQVLKLIPKP
jgi:hypothetical protein